jgi:nucleotide-binding universal stress UspA family protein
VSGGPHSGLAIETARALAIESSARVDVVHLLEESATEEEWEEGATLLRAAEELLEDVDHVDTHLLAVDDVTTAIVTRSEAYDLTVLGAPTAGLLEQFVFGTVPDSVAQRTENTVVMAKHRMGGSSRYHRWIASDADEKS